MYCLLCKEKISRLRSWRTKSEFCSDEHAAQYKKQTLDRLLTEDADDNGSSVPLPLDAPTFDDMDAVADIMGAGSEDGSAELDIFGDLGDLEDDGSTEPQDAAPAAEPAFSPASDPLSAPAFPARSDYDLTGYDGPPVDAVERQTADDAIAALRAIAEHGSGPSPEVPSDAPSTSAPESLDSLESLLDAPAAEPVGGAGSLEAGSLEAGSLEDCLRARAEQEDVETHTEADEEAELELATLSPPEPSFDDEQALLAELGVAETSTEAPATGSADTTEGILDKMVAESDWNAEFQATVDSDFEIEIEQIEQTPEAESVEEVEARAEGPDAPTDDDFEEAVQAAVEPPDADAAPSDDDFVESMMAAVEKVSEDAGEAPAAIVSFPEKNGHSNGHAASELTAEEIEESIDQDPVQVQAEVEDEPPAASEPAAENEAAKPRKRGPARKAPKLKPAMVLAGLHPKAASASDLEPNEAWKRLAARTADDAELAPLIANLTSAAPLLNGSGLKPIGPARSIGESTAVRSVLPAAVTDLNEAIEAPANTATELLAPVAVAVRTAAEPLSSSYDFPASAYQSADAFLAAELAPVAAIAEEKLEIGAPSEPSEPAGLYFDAAADLPESAADEDGDWFADIEGFESL